MLNFFQAKQESRATQARLGGAIQELHNLKNGRFSDALEALASIVQTEIDAKGNQKGHGIAAMQLDKDFICQLETQNKSGKRRFSGYLNHLLIMLVNSLKI